MASTHRHLPPSHCFYCHFRLHSHCSYRRHLIQQHDESTSLFSPRHNGTAMDTTLFLIHDVLSARSASLTANSRDPKMNLYFVCVECYKLWKET